MSEIGKNNNSAPEWFAIAVKPRFEKAVARMLVMKGFETFLPLYKKRHVYAARSKNSELPLFPGYVFSRFHVMRRLPILTTPGVLQILGIGHTPVALPDVEIASLQTAISARFPVEPHPFLQAGERVRIEHGVLAGVEGIVVEFKQSLRLVLSVSLLQRSVLLEIDRGMVAEERRPSTGVDALTQSPVLMLRSPSQTSGSETYQGD